MENKLWNIVPLILFLEGIKQINKNNQKERLKS